MSESSSVFDELLAAQITHIAEFPARDADFGLLEHSMHPRLEERLASLGIERLFSHQTAAYDAAMAGRDIVVVTGTNSGKTLCYNLPALQTCLTEPKARALYMFPTKALAQDQRAKLEALIPGRDIRCGTYDGDTPSSQRSSLRKLAHILLTNPDMLHIGILPSHELWKDYLKSLRLIVLDELHVYRGVFGSHVAGVIRRLLRLCERNRSRPQIIACSATIANPREVFLQLTGREPVVIDSDGSPKAHRTFVFWNPPSINEVERQSANTVSAQVLASLAAQKKRTIAFCRARVSVELLLRYVRDQVGKTKQAAPEQFESYRAGYTPKERRQIEAALFKGELLGLAATNAMELGVDIGHLDAVLMNGYPGTISSFWQQAGRAGRGSRPGLAIMVAHDDPLEQFLIREPHRILDAGNESVSINPQNVQILSQQLKCAAHESPIAPTELESFGATALDVAESLDRSGELEFRAGRFFYPAFEPPAPKVNIRGADAEQIQLFLEGELLGTMEKWRALQNAHEGAVYLHRGNSFVVETLDLAAGQAHVRRQEVDYYTQPIVQSIIEQQVSISSSSRKGFEISLVGIKVTDVVTGYRKKALDGAGLLGIFELELPHQDFETLAVRVQLPDFIGADDLELEQSGVHGLEHALLAVAPLLGGCDRGDLGSAWYASFIDTLKPCVFIFDRTPGGVGLAEKLYSLIGAWMQAAFRLLRSCPCDAGCPACLLSARCEANNEMLDKYAALKLLEQLTAPPSD